jgi:hemerythrin
MAVMEWTEKLQLGLGPMDETHEEFVEDCNRLAAAPSSEVLLAELDVFIEHTIAHFDQENHWMELVGFPGCHKAEHDRVLAVCKDVRKRLVNGDVALTRQLIQELPLWFTNHVESMDAALAAYLASIDFDPATGEIRNPPSAEEAEGACCTPPAQPAASPEAA